MRFEYKNIEIDYIFTDKDSTVTNVYLHGWGGDKRTFLWVANTSTLNTLCIDFPPFGESEEPQEVFTLQDYVDIVLQLCDSLQIKNINIIAHSFGGRVALRIASTTDIVDKMVLVDVAGIDKKSFLTRLKVLNYKWEKWLARIGLLDDWFVGKSGSEDYIDLSPVMKQTFNNIIQVNQRDELRHIKSPCLIIWGDKDTDTTLKSGRYLAKRLSARMIIFDGGHYAFLNNRQRFITEINKFLGS